MALPSSGASCCFTGDSMVTLANGTLKRIDQVMPGDLIKTPFGSSAVDWIRTPFLGDRPLLAMEGNKCKTSAEHCLWTRTTEGDEGWATRDMSQWNLERLADQGPGLNGIAPIDLTQASSATFATEQGWVESTWHTADVSPETKLYHLYLKDHASYFVDGYLVIGELPRTESLIDWLQFTWQPADPVSPVYRQYSYTLPPLTLTTTPTLSR